MIRTPADENVDPPSVDRPEGQFSLRGLLWFVGAASMYFAQIAALPPAGDLSGRPEWVRILTAFVVWFLLGALYVRGRLVGAIIVQGFGPALMFGIALRAVGAAADPAWNLVRASAFGCCASNLFGFPVAGLMILVKAFRRTREWRSY